MGITFYSSIYCPWAARVWLALIEADVPFELVEIDLLVPREPWYLEQINPLGKVPALKLPDGHIICESALCTEYIADLSGKLLPKDPYGRSVLRACTETITTKLVSALSIDSYRKSSLERAETIKVAVTSINKLLAAHLGCGPFLLGSRGYTLVEVNCVPFLARLQMAGENNLLPPGVYEDIRANEELHVFNQYMDSCLSHASHIEVWKGEAVLDRLHMRLRERKCKEDYIFLDELKLSGQVGLSAFSFPDRRFPVSISLKVGTQPVADGSDEYSISYGDVCRQATSVVENNSFLRLEDLSAAIIRAPSIKETWQSVKVEKEGGMLRADKEVFEILPGGKALSSIKGIRIGCIIGVYPHERERKQDVVINLTMISHHWAPDRSLRGVPIEVEEYKRSMLDALTSFVEQSSFKTVEALAQAICDLSLDALPRTVDEVEIWISKPSALAFATHSGVCINRTRTDLLQ